MNRENDGTEALNGRRASETSRRLSDAEHGPGSQAGPLPGFLGHSGESIGPLDDLRGPVGGPLASLPHGGSTLAGGSASVLASPGVSGGGPGNPRAASVLRAVGEFMARQKTSPGRAKRRGRRGGRGVKVAVTAPDSAPLFRGPAFSASGGGCSSPDGTTARIEGQQGRGRGGQGGGAR
jgi:hypothetical protein